MSADLLAVPADADLSAPLARANPVAKLGAATAVSAALLLSLDVVTAGVALVLEIAALPWAGLPPGALWRRARIVLIGAVPAGVGTALFGVDAGDVLAAAGPVSVTAGSAEAGLAILLRVLAIGLPGVVLLATTDPTDLADALAQVLRLPHRFVLAALASLRLFGLLAQEWQDLTLARRARGLGDEGVLGRLRDLFGRVFALLVLAVRRATILATAMEARGFGVATHRTWARPSRFTRADGALVAGGVLVGAVATAAGLAAGTWDLLLA